MVTLIYDAKPKLGPLYFVCKVLAPHIHLRADSLAFRMHVLALSFPVFYVKNGCDLGYSCIAPHKTRFRIDRRKLETAKQLPSYLVLLNCSIWKDTGFDMSHRRTRGLAVLSILSSFVTLCHPCDHLFVSYATSGHTRSLRVNVA